MISGLYSFCFPCNGFLLLFMMDQLVKIPVCFEKRFVSSLHSFSPHVFQDIALQETTKLFWCHLCPDSIDTFNATRLIMLWMIDTRHTVIPIRGSERDHTFFQRFREAWIQYLHHYRTPWLLYKRHECYQQ